MTMYASGNKNGETAMCDCGNKMSDCVTEVSKAAVDVGKSQYGCCCRSCNCSSETMAQAEDAKTIGASIKVLGSGCAKCNALEAAAVEALTELGMSTNIDHVTNFNKIAAYGVMSTPALVIDGKVVSYGKVLKKDEVIEILRKSKKSIKKTI